MASRLKNVREAAYSSSNVAARYQPRVPKVVPELREMDSAVMIQSSVPVAEAPGLGLDCWLQVPAGREGIAAYAPPHPLHRACVSMLSPFPGMTLLRQYCCVFGFDVDGGHGLMRMKSLSLRIRLRGRCEA